MTQQNLADEVGLKFQQIQKYEIGANKPDFEVISKMAKAMNVHLTYFLEPVYETPARGHGNPEIPPDLAEQPF